MVTAEEARRLRLNKGTVNHETYKEIYNKISGRIRQAASRGGTQLEYRIPPLIPGRPMYAISHAVRYNTDKLRNAGFSVEVKDPDILAIDWKTKDTTDPPKKSRPAPKKPPTDLASDFGSATSIRKKLESLKQKLAS